NIIVIYAINKFKINIKLKGRVIMSDNQIKSKKISLKKQFKIVWIVLAVILVCNIIISLISYSSYKKGQDLTAASLIVSDAITGTGKFTSEKLEKDRKGTI